MLCKCGKNMMKTDKGGYTCKACGYEKAMNDPAEEHQVPAHEAAEPHVKEQMMAKGLDALNDFLPDELKKASDKPEEQTDVEAEGGDEGGDEGGGEDEGGDDVEKSEGPLYALTDWMEKGLPSGNRKKMDERDGMSGKAEVGRPEDGGKLAGKGTTSGPNSKNEDLMATADASVKDAGKLDRFGNDDPKDTDEMKSNRSMQTDPQPGASSYTAQGASGRAQNKSKLEKSLDGETTNVVPLEDPAVQELRKSNAAALAAKRNTSAGDVVHAPRVAAPAAQAPQREQAQTFQKGQITYSNASDIAASEMLQKGDFYHGTQPGFDNGAAIYKSMDCPSCGSRMEKAVTVCGNCNAGADVMAKAQRTADAGAEGALEGVRQTHSRGPGLRRPVVRDIVLSD